MWQPPERIKHELPAASWPTPDQAARSLLFQPLELGPRTATARTWIPAMVPWRASEDGYVTDDVIAWYSRFAEGRPGVGTFVTRSLADSSLAAHAVLRKDLGGWLAKARRAGLDDDSIAALFESTFRSGLNEGVA